MFLTMRNPSKNTLPNMMLLDHQGYLEDPKLTSKALVESMGFRMLLGLRNAGCFLTKSQEWRLPQPARDILMKLYDFNNISRWSLIIALRRYDIIYHSFWHHDLSWSLPYAMETWKACFRKSWRLWKLHQCCGLSSTIFDVDASRYSNRSFCFSCNLWQNYISATTISCHCVL